MTKVVFENATIRDVIGKAARVAPTKGSAFEKSNGLLMEVDPDGPEVVLRATNLEIFYMEIADVVSIEGPARTWRLPATVISGSRPLKRAQVSAIRAIGSTAPGGSRQRGGRWPLMSATRVRISRKVRFSPPRM